MTATTLRVVGGEPTLDELASIANAEHRAAVRSAEQVLEHARRAGEALLQARSKTRHGEFGSVIDRCEFGKTTAYDYMLIAENWSNSKVPGAGSLAAALVLIRLSTKKRKKRPAHDLDFGDALTADERQTLLWPLEELPLAPADPAQKCEVMQREDGAAYRCPCCATEWSGDPRPPLRGKLAQRTPGWTRAKLRKLTKEEIKQYKRSVRATSAARAVQ